MIMLALIWGSSFLMLKYALEDFAPLQVSSGRMFFAGLVTLPLSLRFVRRIPRETWGALILFTLIANILTTFLTAKAQLGLGSSTHATLYTMTPIMTLLVGVLLFRESWTVKQITGLAIGLAGSVLLAFRGTFLEALNPFALLALLATLSNGLFTNMLKHSLGKLSTLEIASVSFLLILPLTSGYLAYSGFFTQALADQGNLQGVLFIATLGLLGNALALILLSEIVRISSPVFASLVMYLVPVVALVLGLLDHESIGMPQVAALLLVLLGVGIVNWSRTTSRAQQRDKVV